MNQIINVRNSKEYCWNWFKICTYFFHSQTQEWWVYFLASTFQKDYLQDIWTLTEFGVNCALELMVTLHLYSEVLIKWGGKAVHYFYFTHLSFKVVYTQSEKHHQMFFLIILSSLESNATKTHTKKNHPALPTLSSYLCLLLDFYSLN